MSALTKTELERLTIEGLSVMPNFISREKVFNDIKEGKLYASTSSPETLALAKQSSKYRALILDSAIEKLLNCEVILIPAPICNACASYRGDTPLITLFDGFLDVAVANIEMSYVIQSLPEQLNNIFPKEEFKSVSVTDWVSVLFNSLTSRFISHGEPLPDFKTLLDPALSKNIEHAFLGTLWWVLLHELGHIELGHLNLAEQKSRLNIDNDGLVISQNLSEFQIQELEADAFVFNSLKIENRKLFYYWTNFALGPSMMFETSSGNISDSHPLNVNRIYRALLLSEGLDSVTVELKAKDHLLRHSKAHLNISTHRKTIKEQGYLPIFDTWSRDDIFIALDDLSDIFNETGVYIEPFLNSYAQGWREKFN